MVTPLYSLGPTTATVTVAAPGAAIGAISIPVTALPIALSSGVILGFGSAKFAKLTTAALIGAVALAVDPIPTALVAGDVALVPVAWSHALLSKKFFGLPTDDERTAQHILAEVSLGLTTPAYTGDAADKLVYAVVLQINFQLEQSINARTLKSINSTAPAAVGTTTQYRDRILDPTAMAIVQQVTGRRPVRLTPMSAGV